MNAEEEKRENKNFSNVANDRFSEFIIDIKDPNKYDPIPTGEQFLDSLIHGGFVRGQLTTVYGSPAIGKTAFCQQIAEGIAEHGTPVLYFNLEMDATALYARSLSRIAISRTYRFIDFHQITRYERQNEQTKKDIAEAGKIYRDLIAQNIIYNPEPFTPAAESPNSIGTIEQTIKEYSDIARDSGLQSPVVVIDYLQLIDAGRGDEAETTKSVLNRLNALKKKLNIAIIAISASNRESNKSGTVEMESGRGTSALEYSGDSILGLSYASIEDGEKANGKNIDYNFIRQERGKVSKNYPVPSEHCRAICLKLLKNRYGEPDARVKLYFDSPRFRFLSWKDYEDTDRAERENFEFPPDHKQSTLKEAAAEGEPPVTEGDF